MISRQVIPQVSDVGELQRAVQLAIDKLVASVNTEASSQLDAGGKAVKNVSTPSAPNDAVNLQYLKQSLAGVTAGQSTHTKEIVNTSTTAATVRPAYA
jgi:hypothetical protein